MTPLSRLLARSDKAFRRFLPLCCASAIAAACSSTPKARADETPAVPVEPVEEDTGAAKTPNVSKEACALDSPWPIFQGDVGRSGSSEAPPIVKPRVRWSSRVGVQTWNNNPIVVGENVIVGSAGDVWNQADPSDGIYALDAKSGELAWFAAFDNDVNGVAWVGCRIVAGSDDGTARGLDPITGEVAWKLELDSKVYGQPLPVPGGVLFTTQNSGIHLVDPVQGEILWSAPTGEVRQGAAWDGDSIWVATTGGKIIRFSADGKHQATNSFGLGDVWGAPTIVPDGAVFGFVRDTTYANPALAGFRLSGAPFFDGIDRGTKDSWANVRTSPAYVDGKLIHAEAYSNEVIVTDVASARVDAVVAVGSCMFPQWGSPVANAEEIIVARHDGGLYAIGRDDSKFRWGIHLGAHDQVSPVGADDDPTGRCSWGAETSELLATPAVGADGTLFVGSDEGYLFAVGR